MQLLFRSFFTVSFYTILKICEIFFASLSVDNSVQNSISNEESEIEVSGSDALNSLKNRSIDLVKSIWISLESGAKSSVIVGSIAGVLSILLSTATQSDLPGHPCAAPARPLGVCRSSPAACIYMCMSIYRIYTSFLYICMYTPYLKLPVVYLYRMVYLYCMYRY